jgi:SAM-dependent methyltransferase
MRNKGFSAEGLELDDKMSYELNVAGYKVSQKTLDNFNSDNKYVLVTMFDVIEHIPDVDTAFNRIFHLLENNGVLIIVTPDHNSFQRKLFGKRWFQYKPVEHVNYFTKQSLSIFAERNGFELIYNSSSGQYADAEFILNRLQYYGFSLFANFFKVIFSIFRFKNKFIYTDTGSLLTVFRKTTK